MLFRSSTRMIRTGDVLKAAGLVTEAQIEEALAMQKITGLRLGDILVLKGFVKRGDVVRSLRDYAVTPALREYLDTLCEGALSRDRDSRLA